MGDKVFVHGVSRLVQGRQNSGGKGKTYLYRFAVDSPTINLFRLKRNRPNVGGVHHADEVSFFFKHSFGPMPDRQSMEFTAIQRFVSLLAFIDTLLVFALQVSAMTSFATTGNPNDNVINADMQNINWDAIDTVNPPYKCLNFDEDLTFGVHPDAEALAVWDQMYIDANAPLY